MSVEKNWARRIFNMFIAGFFVVAFLFVFALILEHGFGDKWYKPSTKKTVLTYEMEGYHFSIPRGYIWSFSKIKENTVYEPNLHTLYPNFDPMTRENKHIFNKVGRGDGRLINFHFTKSSSVKSIEEYIDYSIRNSVLKETKRVSDGLVKFDKKLSGYEFVLANSESGEHRIFNCRKEGYVPYPSCNTIFNFNSNIMIQVTFPKKLLSKWKNIEAGLLKLTSSFSEQ